MPSPRKHQQPVHRRSLQRHYIVFALVVIGIGAFLTLAAPRRADAHGYLIRIIPADRAVLDRSPTQLQAWFSEGLEPRFSTLSLDTERGEPIALEDAGVDPQNTAQLRARIPETLPDGLYVVSMRVAFASDGHIFNERLIFWVGQPGGGFAPDEMVQAADLLEIAWRALTLPALAVLFGAPLLYAFVLVPAWGSTVYRAGRLPPRVMIRLSTVAWIAVLAAATGTGAAIIQQSMALFGTDLGDVLRDGLWQIVLNETQIGDILRARLILLGVAAGLLGAGQYVRSRAPVLVRPLWATLYTVAALVLGTISLSSHAAGADLWALPSVAAHWLHTLAISAWVGGVTTLVAVLPVALAPMLSENRKADQYAALVVVLRRFALVGVVAVVLTIATGIYNSTIQIRQPADMWSTPYGFTLIAKLALVVPLLLLGAYHHALVSDDRLSHFLRRRLSVNHLADEMPTESERSAQSGFFRGRALRFETGIAALVLIAAAVLAATPPPVPDITVERPAQTVTVGDLAIQLQIDPGATGANFYQVTLTPAPVGDVFVFLRFVFPERDLRTSPIALDNAGDGVFAAAGADLARAGQWQAQVDILTPEQAPDDGLRAAFWWPLAENPPATSVRQPTVLNMMALFLLGGAFAAWLVPPLVRGIRALRLQRDAVILGGALFVVTVVALVGGGVVLNTSFQDLDRLRNPLPAVTNPTLADDRSLARGREVYIIECAECHGPPDPGRGPFLTGPDIPPVLHTLLDSRRDEQLYGVITNGLNQMPAITITEAEKWAVINYLRSPAFYLTRELDVRR